MDITLASVLVVIAILVVGIIGFTWAAGGSQKDRRDD